MGGYFFLFIASKYPVATISKTIASASVISLTPFRGKEAATLLGRSHLIIEMRCKKYKRIFLGDINNLAASNHFP